MVTSLKRPYGIVFVLVVSLLIFCTTISAYPLHSEQKTVQNAVGIQRMQVTFTSSNYTLYGELYYPSNASGTYPGIVCCEGFAGYVSAYNWIPQALAEQGYIAFIYDPPGQGFSEGMAPLKAIYLPRLNLFIRPSLFVETPIHFSQGTWITAARDAITYLTDKSPVRMLVNASCIGLIGHSLGGLTVTEVAAHDSRVDAVVALSQGDSEDINTITIPVQFQGGGFDLSTHSISILLSCYKKVNARKELVVIAHGTHLGFTTAFNKFCPCPKWQKEICLVYAIGWFDYFLKNQPGALRTITTSIPHLSHLILSRYNFGDGDHVLE